MIIDFGKNKGKELSECDKKYLKWLASHEKVLAERNRWTSRDAKIFLERKTQQVAVPEVKETKAALQMPKVDKHRKQKRVIYYCKKCDKRIARDYFYQENSYRLFRIEGDKVIYQEQDMLCDCKYFIYRNTFKATFINAALNKEHKCNAACVYAKCKDCSCECGGENHGKAFLVEQGQFAISNI